LVKALTGIDPDRLKEEKVREMTIDLGFAWLTLPSGIEVSVVDVPGHERFIRNMLAGAGGVDVALMVVAADEGPMPQTVEHLDILRFLGIPSMVVALTKVELVDDAWLELVSEEVRDLLRGTQYEGAAVVPVSARTGQGLDALLRALDVVVRDTRVAKDIGRPRLPIDRAFTVAGFGTVVTGTLTGGTLRVGQEVEIAPGAIRARIRGLQSHRKRVELAVPGTRVAVNLVGVEVDELGRGMVLTLPGMSLVTQRFFARVRVSPSSPVHVTSGMELECYLGTAETQARIRLLEGEVASAGTAALMEVRTSRPLAIQMGERFILRRPSPNFTVAGGVVLDANPSAWMRRNQLLERLRLLEEGSAEAKVIGTLPVRGGIQVETLWRSLDLSPKELDVAVEQVVQSGKAVRLGEGTETWLMDARVWGSLCESIVGQLTIYHKEYPMRPGMPKEQLRSRLRLDARLASAVLQRAHRDGLIVDQGSVIRLPTHTVRLTPEQELQAARFLSALKASAFNPPSPPEFGIGPEMISVLEERGDVVAVAEGIVFHRDAFREAVETVYRTIEERGSITVADLRDLLNTSRKFALAIMEYMDQKKMTLRVGDARVKR
jgi:selenocysteine-specific elongation factor